MRYHDIHEGQIFELKYALYLDDDLPIAKIIEAGDLVRILHVVNAHVLIVECIGEENHPYTVKTDWLIRAVTGSPLQE